MKIDFYKYAKNQLLIKAPKKTKNKVEIYCFMLTKLKHLNVEMYANETWLFTFQLNLGIDF